MGKLTAKLIKAAPAGKKLGDGDGLQLVVTEPERGKWVYRFTLAGRAREMGLGRYPEVTMTEAREKALAARRLAHNGVDPIEAAKKNRTIPTFGALADEVATDLSHGFRNAKHKAQWRMTLAIYAAPLRDKPVDAITTEDVLAVLRPLWQTRPETANRLRGRIERVLSAAKAKGLRVGENPAAWRGHLDNLLAKRGALARGHHAALPYADIPTFVAKLRERDATAARALEFAILTAARSGEVIGARWAEVDIEARLWTIPPERTKGTREHVVPLSDRAAEILEARTAVRRGDFVFPGARAGKPMSPPAMGVVLRQMGSEATVHGFRSSFRDWAGDVAHAPREIAEAALAHTVGSRTERAYRRGDALDQRRKLMDAWSAYCGPTPSANIVDINSRRA
jgi:integrase